jgi:CHAD domain-containing protein
LRKLIKRFARSGQRLNAADDKQLHALRIIAKKLRYSAEFFASLYGKRKAQAFLAALSEVQEALGQINDVAVAHRLLDGLVAGPALSAQQEAIALAKGWIAHDLSRQFAALRKAMQHFDGQPAFWGK